MDDDGRAASLLQNFLELNPGVVLHPRALNNAAFLESLDWGELDRQGLLELLRGIGRLAPVEADPLRAQALWLAGFDSASNILGSGPAGFIATIQEAIGAQAAWSIYNRAKAVRSRTLHQWMRVRESLSPYHRMLSKQTRIGPGGEMPPPPTAPGVAVNYSTIFGQAPYSDVPHDASILGPGAYFADLMALIQRAITDANPDQGPLALQRRRPDLWNQLLTADNATKLVSNAALTLEILESTMAEFDPGAGFLAPAVPHGFPVGLRTPQGWPRSFQAGTEYILDAGGSQIDVSSGAILQSTTLKAGRGFQQLVIDTAPITVGALQPAPSAPDVVLEGFVIAFASTASATSLVQIAAGSLTLRNCVLVAARVPPAPLPNGWAISVANSPGQPPATGTLVIDRCTFLDQSPTPQATMIDVGGSGPLTLSASNSILWSTYAADRAGGYAAIELGRSAVANLDFCDVRGGAQSITSKGAPATGRLYYADTCFDEDPLWSSSALPHTIFQRTSPCVGRGDGGCDVGATYDLYDALAWAVYPFDLPCDLDFDTAEMALAAQNIDLDQIDVLGAELLPAYAQNAYFVLSQLGLCLADYMILSGPAPADLDPFYGLPAGGFQAQSVVLSPAPATTTPAYAFPAATFASWLDLKEDALRELIYQNLGPTEIAQNIQGGGGGAGLDAWAGFYINGWGDGTCNTLALRTEYAPVGRYALQLGQAGGAAFPPLASPPTGAFTVTFWVFADGPQETAILQITDAASSLSLGLDGAALVLTCHSDQQNQQQTLDLSAYLAHPQWLNLAMVYDDIAKTFTVYANGQTTVAAPVAPILWPSGPVLLGSAPGKTHGFTGSVCDLAIWSLPLSGAEIAAQFQMPTMAAPAGAPSSTPPPAGLLAYWPLNDNGPALLDWSNATQPDNGKLTGQPTWGFIGLPNQPPTAGATNLQDDLAFVQTELLTGTAAGALGPQGVTAGNLDRINRFARLARRMDWTYTDLDWALFTADRLAEADAGHLTTFQVFAQLAKLQFLQAQLQCDIPSLCAFFGVLKPFGRGRLGDQHSPFDRVFNPPPLAATAFFPDMSIQLSVAHDFDEPGEIARRLAELLEVTTADLAKMVKRLASGNVVSLDGVILTGLFCHDLLQRWTGLPADAYLDLLDFVAMTPIGTDGFMPEDLSGFVRAVAWIMGGGLSPSELRFLSAPNLPDNPYQNQLGAQIREQLPKTTAALEQSLAPWRITAASFISPLVTAPQSAEVYDRAVAKGFVDPDSGIMTAALWSQLPAAPYRAPSAAYKTVGDAVRAAVKALNAGVPAASVLVAPGYYAASSDYGLAVELANGTLTIQSDSGPGATVIDCGGHDRFLNLTSRNSAQVIVSGLTIQGGAPAGSPGGGAIYSVGRLRVVNSILKSNTAANGGAIYVAGPGPNVVGPGPASPPYFEAENCVFYNNTSGGSGGALYFNGVSAVINGCTLYANSASRGEGDGVYLDVRSSLALNLSIAWDDLTNTTLDWAGGGAVVCNHSDTTNPEPTSPLGIGCICLYPEFIDPLNGLFGLQPGSPCEGSGPDGQDMGYGGSMGEFTLVAMLAPPALGQIAVLSAQLASNFGGGNQPFDAVLSALGPYQNGLQILTAGGQDNGPAVTYMETVFLYLLLCARFGIDGDTFTDLIAAPGLLSLTGVGPSDATPYLPTSEDLHTLARYAQLRGEYPDLEAALLAFLAMPGNQTPSRLAALFGWDMDTVVPLLAACQIEDWMVAASTTTTAAYVSAVSGASAAPYGADLTLEAWVMTNSPTAPSGSGAASNILVACNHPAGGFAFWLGFTNDSAGQWALTFQVQDSAGQVAAVAWPDAIRAGAWTHVAGVFAAGTLTLYVDGQPSPSSTAAFAAVGWAAGDLLVMGQDDQAGADVSGLTNALAEVRCWSVARTPQQILANRRRHISRYDPGSASLFGYWTFVGGSIAELTGGWTDAIALGGVTFSQGVGGPVPVTLRSILTVADGVNAVANSGLDPSLLLSLYRNGLILGAAGAAPLIEALQAKDQDAADALDAAVTSLKRELLKRYAKPAINAVTAPLRFPVVTDEDLSDYLLLDVKMGVETSTAPVLQATLSLQQYVQRCRLDLEPLVSTVAMTEREWNWAGAYRRWEANRKVFLYPETYLRPELRKDKTPLFTDLEHGLAGAATTKASLEALFKRYLDQFTVLSTLKTVGCWYEPAERVDSYVSAEAASWLGSLPLQQTLSTDISTFTIEGWVRTAGADAGGATIWFFGHTGMGVSGLAIGLGRDSASGQPTFYVRDAGNPGQLAPGGNIAFGDGQWVHLCGVFDYGAMSLYANGTLCGSATADFLSVGLFEGLGVFAGHQPSAGDVGCLVHLAELRFWSTARTQEQILANMSCRIQTSDPSFASLLGYWTFDKASPDESTGHWCPWVANGPAGSITYTTAPRDMIATAPAALDAYHFIGRSGNTPYAYYHRVKQLYTVGGVETPVWRPWESIGLTINSPYATPVVVNGRLYIFWIESEFQDANGDTAPAKYKMTIKYSWHNEDGSWLAPQAPFPVIEVSASINFEDPRWNRLYAAPIVSSGDTAVLVMYYARGADPGPRCFILNWDQSISSGLSLHAGVLSSEIYSNIKVLSFWGFDLSNPSSLVAQANVSIIAAFGLDQTAGPFQQSGDFLAISPPAPDQSVGQQSAYLSVYTGFGESYRRTVLNLGGSPHSSFGLGSAFTFYGTSWIATVEASSATNPRNLVVPLYSSNFFGPLHFGQVNRNIMPDTPESVYGDNTVSLAEWNGRAFAAISVGGPVQTTSIYTIQTIGLGGYEPWTLAYKFPTACTGARLLVGDDGGLRCLTSDGTNICCSTYSVGSGWSASKVAIPNGGSIFSNAVYFNKTWYMLTANVAPQPITLWSTPSLSSVEGWAMVSVSPGNYTPGSGGPLYPLELGATAECLMCFFMGAQTAMAEQSAVPGYFCYSWVPRQSVWTLVGFQPNNITPFLTPATGISPLTWPTILGSGPAMAHSAPIGNQLGAYLYGGSGPEFLIEALDSNTGLRLNSQIVGGSDAGGHVTIAGVTAPQLETASLRFERMTTTIAPALSKALAKGGVDGLLSLASQGLQEASFTAAYTPRSNYVDITPPSDDGVQFGLDHPFAAYHREIFFYIPWLIAQKLSKSNQFHEAQTFLEYIFRPSAAATGDDYWLCTWLQGVAPIQALQSLETIDPVALALYWQDPFDATAIADLRPSAYQRAIVTAYIQNLIDWGDSLFADNTRESINQAEQIYRYASDLLGPRPKRVAYTPPPPESWSQLSGAADNQFLIALEQVGAEDGESAPSPLPEGQDPNGSVAGGGFYFGVPDNQDFLANWDRVEDRLYKLRHGLDLSGAPDDLPLFEPPMSLDQILAASRTGGGRAAEGGGGAADPKQIEHFSEFLFSARMLANSVVEFGSTLQRALEMQDSEGLAVLQMSQQTAIAERIAAMRVEDVNSQIANLTSLQAALTAAKHRSSFYGGLIRDGLSIEEIVGVAAGTWATTPRLLASTLNAVAASLYPIPTIFGLADGGQSPGHALQSMAMSASEMSGYLSEIGTLANTLASYERRQQDWSLQLAQANFDVRQITAQITAAERQKNALQQQHAIDVAGLQNARALQAYYRDKFSNGELYGWMADTLSQLYSALYQVALNVAQMAQATLSAFTGTDQTYISTDAWDGRRRGFLAGESLLLDLARLEQAYLQTEMSTPKDKAFKTVSLRRTDPRAYLELVTTGACAFELSEAMFDRDHPGHYQRVVQSLSVQIKGLPADARSGLSGQLTRLSHDLVRQPDPGAVRFLLGATKDYTGRGLLRGFNPCPASLSHAGPLMHAALQADGPDFDSGEIGAFAGGGAVSRWRLSLPPERNRMDRGDIADVVITLRYGARYGGDAFRREVEDALPPYRGSVLVDLAPSDLGGHATLAPLRDHLPRNLPGRSFAALAIFVGGFDGPAPSGLALSQGRPGGAVSLKPIKSSGQNAVGAEFASPEADFFDTRWALEPVGEAGAGRPLWLLAEFEEA